MSSRDLHPTSGYSNAEEWANSITHGIGSILSIAGLVVAVVVASIHSNGYMITACSLYGATLILLHFSSTLYHSFRNLKWKRVFLVADHSSIYLLIAGTYTPFCLGPLRGAVGWTLFGIIWGLAIVGILREILKPERGTWLSTAIYLAMGWLVVAFLFPLIKTLSTPALILLVSGGLLYSLGVVFYKWHSLKFHHAIWHLFVMGGAACQFLAVMTLLK
ncbi:hemolysin III family protein [Puniceicoccales bacterium CK1056]|uniref:Hemolysin III family protein n=1 Tax=Oceanipulchritudo coccoides TaxID=2706888 RepID=A0A6B2M1R7_9BACT|nr:hemolysin III family protein [Oceanipulchritudo coccoides]NDV62878.1 hemolysin III family protein [Oceanipulchritudo coccoides]